MFFRIIFFNWRKMYLIKIVKFLIKNFTIFIKYIFLQLKKIILKNIFLAYNIFILSAQLKILNSRVSANLA